MVNPSKFIGRISPYKLTPQDVWSDFAPKDLLKLDWNESPNDFSFYIKALERFVKRRGSVAWYPDTLSIKLTAKISEYIEVNTGSILTFPGSDVGLEAICRAYLDPNDVVGILCPTYENFFVFAAQTGATLNFHNLAPPFQVDREVINNAFFKKNAPKIIYLVNPNNPCGYMLQRDEIMELVKQYPDTLFIIDEAYIEFSGCPSMATDCSNESNLVVTRTFSKCFGLAGMRLGYIVASPAIIHNVSRVRNPKNVSMLSQYLGIEALENLDLIESWIREVKSAKKIFENWCDSKNIEYYPSAGNFVFLRVKKAVELCGELRANGVFIRDRNHIFPGAIRVTIGSKKDTLRLIKEIEKVCHLV